jgi:beta-N-acetylhexosaminidase
MLAFEGTEPSPLIKSWLTDHPPAGFTLFRELNIESIAQLRALTAGLQEAANQAERLPLLIATDHEGGQLLSLGDEAAQFPGNMALGAAGDIDLARRVGRVIGLELAAVGVNINYAPICDINTNPDNPSLGVRSFGDDPELAAGLAGAMVAGIQSSGVAATLKHFPGKGAANVDSHYQLPMLDHSRERLKTVELLPFEAAIDAGAKLVMTGHFAIPALTGSDTLPATLSRAVMHDLLREELGFEGVVITDALDMGAITQGAGQIIDVIAAVRAEVDLLLITADEGMQSRVFAGLQLAYSRGLIGESHLQPSFARIKALKQWAAGHSQPDLSVVGCREHQELARSVAEQSITLIRDQARLLPMRPSSDARIAVVMPQPKNLTPADTSSFVKPSLAAAVRRYHPGVDEFITSHPPTVEEIAALKARAVEYDILFIGTMSASMQPEQALLVNELLATGVPTLTISLRTPYDLLVYPQAQTHICTYSALPVSMHALAAAVWGEAPFSGRLPVHLPGLYSRGHGLDRT